MKLSKLISKKSNTQPRTLRSLTREECRLVAGGRERAYVYSAYTSGGKSSSGWSAGDWSADGSF